MAVTTENANLVWQKVKMALADVNPAIYEAFMDLKMYLSTQGRNPDLQFIPYSEAQAIINNGTDLTGGAGTLYGHFSKAVRTTGTTSAFVSLHASADQTGEVIDCERFKATGQKVAKMWPSGKAFATGLCISSATTVGGTTESTTPDGPTGFVIVGA